MPRDTDTHKMRIREWAALLFVLPCAILRILLASGWDWSICRTSLCLSAAVVRSRDPCTRPTQLCPHGSAAASPPALPAHRLHCRTAARGWGCSPGLVLEPGGFWK